MKVVILGAGSLGSVIGAFLARSKQEVVLIGREGHVDLIRKEGLRVRGLEPFTVAVEATADPKEVDEADFLLLTTKTYDSEAALNGVSFDVKMVASLQNGVIKNDLLARRFGRDKVVGALTGVGASMVEPGVVDYTYNGATVFGELGGERSDRILRAVDVFTRSGLKAEVSESIEDDEWSKLCQYCAASMASTLSRFEYHRVCSSRPLAELFVTISREAEAVARALGHRLGDVASFRVEDVLRLPYEEAVRSVMERGRALEEAGMTNVKISMLQDLEAGRRVELEETVGYVVREGDRLGIETPALSLAYQVVKGVVEAPG